MSSTSPANDTSVNDNSGAEGNGKETINVVSAGLEDGSTKQTGDARADFLASFTTEEEKAALKKRDAQFFWLIGIMYLIKQIDQTNTSYIRVLQLGEPRNIMNELNMTSNEYNWVASLYGISFIIFEVPSNLLLKKFSPHNWQARIFFTWGIITACHAAVQTRDQLYAVRFLLGAFEAGMFPGILSQLPAWYRTDETQRPFMWMYSLVNVSGILGAILCYAISYMNGMRGLSAWRWVFLLEGLATILFSGVVYWKLPDYPKSPRTKRFLTEREQEFVETRLSENAPLTDDPAFKKQEIIDVLKNPLLWAFMACQTFINLGGYALMWYLPTIITNLGFTGLPSNQLLNIPPSALAIIAIILAALFLNRAFVVRPAVALFFVGGMAICFILFFTIDDRVGLYIACNLSMFFYQGYFLVFWSWRSATLTGSTGTAFTLALQSGVAQIGIVVGPQLFQSKWAYNGYKISFAIGAVFIFLSVIANLWTWWLTRNTEYDVLLVRRNILKDRAKGKVYSGDDIRIFSERQYYDGLKRRGQDATVA